MKKLIFFLAFIVPTIAHAGPVETRFITATPTVDTNIYASGDTIGSYMTFSKACLAGTAKGQILGVKIFDKSKTGVDIDLVLLNSSSPAGTFTDNAAFDPNDSELSSIVAIIPVTTHKAFSDNGISQAANILYPVRCNSDMNIFGYLVSRGTPTYAASGDVTLQIEVVAD